MRQETCKKLLRAYMLVCNAGLLTCFSDERELTKGEIALIRDYLPDAESDLADAIADLLGEVEVGRQSNIFWDGSRMTVAKEPRPPWPVTCGPEAAGATWTNQDALDGRDR